ncbi:MAG: DUF721 domain-containing protein [Candidatus Kapaibacterium sp.]
MALDREPQDINSLFDSMPNKFNLAEKRIIVDLRNNVKEIISENFSKSVVIYDLKNGKLILKVSNPVWKTEIQLRKDQIVEKFNVYLGANIIKNIVLH